ncbi:hypothetical protein KUCAC02_013369 [Chaenocephalus aceratus]|nr:hypothetical protein KUCAC02_013369 [Chaenocephalus aceratus]
MCSARDNLMSAESSSSLPESELCFLASVQTKAWRLWRASCPGLTRPRSFLQDRSPRCLALAVPGSARVDLHRRGAGAGKGARTLPLTWSQQQTL